MPVYNGAVHLAEALDSLLAQTFGDFEVILADNASTDRSAEIALDYASRDPRIRFHRNDRNLGAAANFNHVFALARSEYFKWFAHDDRLEPDYLHRCVAALDAGRPRVVLVFPQRVEITYEGRWMGPDRRVRWFEAAPPYDGVSFARSMLIPARRFPTLVFGLMPAEVLRKTRLIGPYHYADLVLLTELRMLGEFRHLSEPLFVNRLHERRSVEEEAAWYDPQRALRLRRPASRLLRERLRGVWRSTAGFGTKLWASACVVLLGHLVARTPVLVEDEFARFMATVYGIWERATAGVFVRFPNAFLPHRVWMLLAGLRRLDSRAIRLSLGPESPEVCRALSTFAAERLARRRDRIANEILLKWVDGECVYRRAAATSALGQEDAVTSTSNV